MNDTLVNRLRGLYTVGPNAEFGTRSFADFVAPIQLEAADEIDRLNARLEVLYESIVEGEEGRIIELDVCGEMTYAGDALLRDELPHEERRHTLTAEEDVAVRKALQRSGVLVAKGKPEDNQ